MFNLIRCIKFFIIGASGVIINYCVYNLFRNIIPNFYITLFSFNIIVEPSWLIGIFISAFSNYILNEIWTFKK